MTCLTTVFMGHLSTWVCCTLAARFRPHHSQDVSLHFFAESSLDRDSKFPAAITDCQMETFNLPPDHGQQLKSSSLTDDSEDFHCEHFAVQIHFVVFHLLHTPNFERQSRVSGITFRTHMHGSHTENCLIATKPTTIPSKFSSAFSSLLFCVYICGHQRRRRAASNSVNLFLFFFLSCHSLASL